MLAHCFPEEFQRRLLIACLGEIAFQHLALMIDGPPEIMPLAVVFHEDLVEMSFPLAGFHLSDPTLSDLPGEHRAEPVPPETDGLVAHIDTAPVRQVLDVPQGQWKADVEHHREADDLWAGI
jgi:hypothetical protein